MKMKDGPMVSLPIVLIVLYTCHIGKSNFRKLTNKRIHKRKEVIAILMQSKWMNNEA